MTDDFDMDQLEAGNAPQELLPDWYREIFPAGLQDGFYEKLGQHALIHVDRGAETLVVTFDNLSDAGYPGYDVKAWAEKFIRDNSWSHLGVVAQGPTWFREMRLITRLEQLAAQGFFTRFDRVVMAGTSMGGFGALAFADLAPGCDVIAFSPQSTLAADLVPWEKRFGPGRAQDWSLPRSDAAGALNKIGRLWVIYDPFLIADLRHVARLPADRVIELKAFGQGHKTAMVLRRMDLLKEVMFKAVRGTLTQSWFYRATRRRKDIYIYRKSMEDHLNSRGKAHRVPHFIRAFRARARRNAKDQRAAAGDVSGGGDSSVSASGDPPRPTRRMSAITTPHSAALRRYPSTLGNVWHLFDDGVTLRYLSDQYRQQVMGFEERDEVTLAQSPQIARGMVAFGGAAAIPRPLSERFDFHIRDESLSQDSAPQAAEAHGAAVLTSARAVGHALPTVIAISQPQPGIVAAEARSGAPLLERLVDRVEVAREAMVARDRILYVDRISLDLLAGNSTMPELEAATHYLDAIRNLRETLASAAGQISFPHIVITQKPGTRTDGTSQVILAEGRLDIHESGLGILVASPSYMLRLMPDTEATLDPADRLWLDELEALAVEAAQDGQPWYCPALRQVFRQGDDLVVEFAAMGPLEFDSAATVAEHGFALVGCTNDARITGLQLDPPRRGGQRVVLTMDRRPEGSALAVTYAWGARRESAPDDVPANQGALREVWSQPSLLQPSRALYRYALSGKLPVMPSDLGYGRSKVSS